MNKNTLITIVNIESEQTYFSKEHDVEMLSANSRLCGIKDTFTTPWVLNGRYIQFIMKPSKESEKRIIRELNDINVSIYFYTAMLGDISGIKKTNSMRMNGPVFWAARDAIDAEKEKIK